MAKPPDPAQYVDLDEIVLWPENYNEGDVGAIARSIRRHGYRGAVRLWRGQQAMAGNHSVLALRALKAEGPDAGFPWPPKGEIVEYEGRWYVRYVDISDMTETEAVGFAIADNRTAALASQDDRLLLKYLSGLRDDDAAVFEASGYDDDDLARLRAITHADTFDHDADGQPFFDATDLPGAVAGAAKGAYLIYVSFPDRDSFLQALELLEGARRGLPEGARLAAVDGAAWLGRMLPDGT